jgi:nitroreductase
VAIETAAREDSAREPLIVRLRRRRVTRDFTGAPVAEEHVRLVLEGGRWATSGSNLRLHKFVVVEDAALIDLAIWSYARRALRPAGRAGRLSVEGRKPR